MLAEMTDGILNTIKDWTGDRPASCPWRAFYDPFVMRVMRLQGFFESGQLDWYVPNPSHRLAEGVMHYEVVRSLVRSKGLEQEAEKRRRNG